VGDREIEFSEALFDEIHRNVKEEDTGSIV
jgi:hypothetical protein